jgi:hypothetical protein
MYVEGNPINYTDPAGNIRIPCVAGWNAQAVGWRVDEAEKYVYHTSDPIDTYTAAGIAIQCAGWDNPFDPNSGVGIAQVSINQAETEREKEIEGGDHGYGLRLCLDGVLEDVLDPNNNKDAVVLMKRRIQQVTNRCLNCSSTDIFIAAGLAQNGPGFNWENMKDLVNGVYGKRIPPKIPYEITNEITIPWRKYWDYPGVDSRDTSLQLQGFAKVTRELQARRWIVPYVDWTEIDNLSR